jgi:hypothetical protein
MILEQQQAREQDTLEREGTDARTEMMVWIRNEERVGY